MILDTPRSPVTAAASPLATYSMTIGGRAARASPSTSTSTSTPATLTLVDPATGEPFAQVPDATHEQLDAAVAAARQAQPAWAATPLPERRALLGAIAGALIANIDALSRLLTQEQGKPLARAVEELQMSAWWLAETAQMPLDEDVPLALAAPPVPSQVPSQVRLQRRPLGVVGAIVPWNFPVAMAIFKLAPALLAGNTVVLKPSPFTPATMLCVGELLRGVLPDGVLNVVSGGDALGPWMTAHPGIDKISFTGATATGRDVMAAAAPTLKRLTLELGGNDAAIVLDDADVEAIAPLLFWGAFANSAQFCLAIKRLYVHERVYDRLAAALVRLATNTPMGHGLAPDVLLGPIQNRPQFERLKALLGDCKARGLRLLCGGELADGPGFFFPVTLVDNPPEDSPIVQREPFGPILPLLRFHDVDDAVARANASPFGLGASVWSADPVRALAVAQRLEAGTVWVNEIHTLSPHKPMAGAKQSGIGVEFGADGLREFTQLRVISMAGTGADGAGTGTGTGANAGRTAGQARATPA